MMRLIFAMVSLTFFAFSALAEFDPAFNINPWEFTPTGARDLDTTLLMQPQYLSRRSKAKQAYQAIRHNKNKPLNYVPSPLLPMVRAINKFILETAHNSPKSRYHTGPSGNLNPSGFRWNSKMGFAKKIVQASYCFGIEPYVLASVIAQESKFKINLSSKTNAAGPTQITGINIVEFLEQMGVTPGNYALKPATIDWNQLVRCYYNGQVNSRGQNKIWSHFTHPLLRTNTAKYAKTRAYSKHNKDWKRLTRDFKSWAYQDADRFIVVGAWYLKHNLTRKYYRHDYSAVVAAYNASDKKFTKGLIESLKRARKSPKTQLEIFFDEVLDGVDRLRHLHNTNSTTGAVHFVHNGNACSILNSTLVAILKNHAEGSYILDLESQIGPLLDVGHTLNNKELRHRAVEAVLRESFCTHSQKPLGV